MQTSIEEVDSRGAGDGNDLDDAETVEVAAALEVVVVNDNLSQDSLNPVSNSFTSYINSGEVCAVKSSDDYHRKVENLPRL